jgi:hypothetical protein
MGATTEWRKMEGITFDSNSGNLYLAMSEVTRGMEDNPEGRYDMGGPNHIRLPANHCGAVYVMDTERDDAMNSDFVAKTMKAEITGHPINNDPNNSCAIDGIANPDNVTLMTGYNTLIIGEDAGSGHQNDMLWAYDLATKSLTRIQTTPYGSETTSPYWYTNINGWSYLMSVVQHPYSESDQDKYKIGSMSDRGYTGYIGPFPARAPSSFAAHPLTGTAASIEAVNRP